MHTIPTSQAVYLMGDYHKQQRALEAHLTSISWQNVEATLILLGDYDVHTDAELRSFLDILARYQNINYYLLRGNHDNPEFWQDHKIAADYETDHITLLKDIDAIQYNGQRILTVSGAISVDRTSIRFDRGECWPDTECVPPRAIEKVKSMLRADGPFDIMLSHTGTLTDAPIKNHFTESFATTDDTLLDDLADERKLMGQLLILSGVRESYFGHFHQNWSGEEYGIPLKCLDICNLLRLNPMCGIT